MFRFSSFATVIAVSMAVSGATALAQSQAEIAEKLNQEGKELMYSNNYAEASKKFQEAVARVPEAKYFFNLCVSRANEGRLDEAITACNAVDLNSPSTELKGKKEKMVTKINEMAKSQGVELHPEGEGGGGGGGTQLSNPPRNPQGTQGNPNDPRTAPPTRTAAMSGPPRYAPPSQNLAYGAPPDNKYTWTLGVDLFGGGGQIGQKDYYGSAMGGFRIKSDYLIDPVNRYGGQVYLQYLHLGQGSNDTVLAEQLDVIDVGVAGYKHLCLGGTPRACITPLVGVQLSLMSPEHDQDEFDGSQVFNYAGLGARGELAFTYAFGRRYEHALSIMGGINLYSPLLAGPSRNNVDGNLTIEEAGLDKAGFMGYLGLGYTYRFNTPLGSSPFVTLE